MKHLEIENIVLILLIVCAIILFSSIFINLRKQENQSIQPEIIQELQEDSKFVKITIDIIKETEVIENE